MIDRSQSYYVAPDWLVVGEGETCHRCPHCGFLGTVRRGRQIDRWLPGYWMCPDCEEVISTETLNNATE
jgi:hypothetical protein